MIADLTCMRIRPAFSDYCSILYPNSSICNNRETCIKNTQQAQLGAVALTVTDAKDNVTSDRFHSFLTVPLSL